jgi:hypothetical protein
MTTSTTSKHYLAETFHRHLRGLYTGKVSDDEFFAAFHTSRDQVVAFGSTVLQQALTRHDKDLVVLGGYVGHRFGFSADAAGVLMALAEATWHTDHENVVSALDKLRDPSSVDVLYRTALAQYDYLDYDDSHGLGVKCVRALSAIATESALQRLGQLAHCGNQVLEQQAISQLNRLLAKPPPKA